MSRVYVGHLSSRATERDVEHFFKGCGRIREIMLKNGFGFVEFDDSRDADDAVYELNGRDLCGERVIVELSRRGPRGGGYGGRDGRGGSLRYAPPVRTRHRMLVTNLSTRCSWQELKDMMRTVAEVTYADAHKQVRNEAFVCFATREDLKRAIDKFQGKEINGRKIKLVDDSEGGGGGRRSRSRTNSDRRTRSRTRSRSPRSRSPPSRSRSRSKSPAAQNGRSRSRSASRSSRSRSASKE